MGAVAVGKGVMLAWIVGVDVGDGVGDRVGSSVAVGSGHRVATALGYGQAVGVGTKLQGCCIADWLTWPSCSPTLL